MSNPKTENKFLEQGFINEAAMLAYLNNELTAEEKQQFEKLLQEDPFAQEALEGLQSSQNNTVVTQTIFSINQKVYERTGAKDKKIFQLHWTNFAWAAALLVLLIGIGAVMITYIGKKDSRIALAKEQSNKAEDTGLFQTQKREMKPAVQVLVLTDTPQKTLPSIAPAIANQEKMVNTTTSETADRKGKATTVSIDKSNVSASDISKKPETFTPKKETTKVTTPLPAKNEPVKKEQLNSVAAPSTQKIMQGSAAENATTTKVAVASMADAMKNFNSGNYKESGEQFTAILQQQPNSAEALYFGGISDYINGNSDKSEKSFDKLLKGGNKYVDGSKWYKANILLQKGKRDEAKKLFVELSQSNGSYKDRAIKKIAEAGL